MVDVLRANGFAAVVVGEVVVAVRQREATLAGGGDLPGGVFLILLDRDGEDLSFAEAVDRADVECGQGFLIGEGVDVVQLRLDRPAAESIEAYW